MAGIAGLRFNPASTFSPATTCPNPTNPSLRSPSFLRFSKLPIRGGRSRLAARIAVVARYGGGGGGGYYRPSASSGESRRRQGDARVADSEYDAALDLDRVKSSTVRLLDEQQNMIGVFSKREAIQMADDADLILAILSPDADPPVLRLFDSNDYKKHKYEQQKKKRVQQKRSAANRVDIKELKMGYNIDSHDYAVRMKAAKKFLKDGDKVKVIVNLKGRENEFRSIAIELLKRFQSDVGEVATMESKNFSERNIFMILMPNKAALQKAQEQPKRKEAPATEVSASV